MNLTADIVFAVQVPLTARDRDRYGFAFFQQQGLRVGVLDAADEVMPMLGPHRREQYDDWTDIDIQVLPAGGDWSAARRMLKGAKLIINHIGSGYPQPGNLSTLRLIAASKTPVLLTASNIHPAAVSRPAASTRRSLWQRLRRAGIANSVLARLPLAVLGLRHAEFVVLGARRSSASMPLIGPRTHCIQAHAQDYDQGLRYLNLDRRESDNIAVYIDVFMGFHPDSIADGLGLPVRPESFYPRLRVLFDRIEQELGLEVVISAHPRSDYTDKPDLYGNRRIISGQTVDLIKACKLALGIHSTASSFAVMFNKPLMVLSTQEMRRHPSMIGVCESLAAALGRDIDCLDHPDAIDLIAARTVNRDAYNTYLADYIKYPGTPDRPYWDLILTSLRENGTL
jgi:hypothetical protein